MKKTAPTVSWCKTPLIQRTLAVMAISLMPACGGEDIGELRSELTSAAAEQSTMLATARAFLEDRNQQLMDNASVSTGSIEQNVSEPMSVRVAQDNAALRALRDRLALLGERYAGFRTDARIVEVQHVEGKVIARIEETTELDYARLRGDEPPSMAFRVERAFTFSKRGEAWVIEDVQLQQQGGIAPINEVVTAPAASIEQPASPSTRPSDISKEAFQKNWKLGEVMNPFYNYSAMASYATTWALGRNPAYRSFPNDCTNFISQAVSAGGWVMVPGWYQSNDAWWYNSINQSYTWAGAHNWYFFATGSGRTLPLSNVWYMLLADVLQMDFERDGNINHTMMVTAVSSSDLYLSYHSTDTRNRSLSSIIAAYPSAWYYAHRT